MKGFFNLSHLSAGFTTVLVGYTSSVVIVIQAATASGANPAQIESWLLTLGVVMGLTSILYSWFYKTPIVTAWSTPAAVMLAASAGQYSLPVVIGAFMFSGALFTLTGMLAPLTRALSKIPVPLGTAMLGAILLPFCAKAFTPLTDTPALFALLFTSYLLAKHFVPRYTMLVLLLVSLSSALALGSFQHADLALRIATPIWVTPEFDWLAMLNLALPLYLITMLSQNLPGIAMLKSYQYDAPIKPILVGTGLATLMSAPFGGFSVNLAAISAAICMNEDVDQDKAQRYRAVLWAGGFYLLAGIFAALVVNLFLALPKPISAMLAGLALLGTLMMCLQSAFKIDEYREPALLTFVITLSGATLFGMSATLIGLVIGLAYLRLTTRPRP
ncbi:TPA: benzoate/H(+) symporter BenE family transporter [Vibrio cholerae]|uniref:benzoate/H(+) symporter BenE family transporter n=1 Tax=Vibrio cholerae TaxID=666 RepID=UPI00084D0B75|nr:benzoate/H(+) symporter BenE family transporter [Vibrio cholerae]EGR0740975.1 benzoate transporter BenE [Vibrio cholerae]EGR0753992.1 benzoate transporter BenE [Vibrio cholerae]EGR0818563.1 benzoate transporter BenE [Vibrio cholerae]EIC2296598.1 benzoate/H(+) symporter BenE family transporter [Vibrio cholerae]EJL6329637.1 benzoate/H(+) symporter BenE family transporter [Vibrio cholerae]